MPLTWTPGKWPKSYDGADGTGEVVASVSYRDNRAAFPDSRPFWVGWLRNTVRVPGQHATADEAMAATDRAWDREAG